MKINLTIFIFLFLLLNSCKSDPDNVAVVQEFIDAEPDEKKNFLTSDFQLQIPTGRVLEEGEKSIWFVGEQTMNWQLSDTKYKNLRIEEIENDSIRVSYSLESWLAACFGHDLTHEDFYSLKEAKIEYLRQSVNGSAEPTEYEIELQSDFRKWATKLNLTDSIEEHQGYIKYLKVYCESISTFEDDI